MRALLLGILSLCSATVLADQRPNFIIILTDDQGYNDLKCFGSEEIDTPNIDRMAREGRRFTHFYVGAPSCTPSRAALLTGCYPVRVGFGDAIATNVRGFVSPSRVLHPNAPYGLNPDETTIADLLKDAGYATGMVGKWHLGDAPKFNPVNYGFDEFFGVPYSNDMEPYYYLRGKERLDEEVDRNNQIRRYTDEAVEFIRQHREEPFFLYLAHTMPHTPLNVSDEFRGKSERGRFGDAVEEIDWSTGELVKCLEDLEIDERTLVIFTSDNGPWHARGERGGSAFPLRGAKGSTYEGGVRVPCVVWQPGTVPAGTTCSEVAAAMDLLPTLAAMAGAKKKDQTIDGHDISPLIKGEEGAKSPWEHLLYYFGNELHAVRSGRWKYRAENNLKNENVYWRDAPDVTLPPALYDLERDPGEQKSVLKDHPKITQRLRGYLEQAREELGDSLTGKKPTDVRPIGRVEGAPEL